MKKKCMSAISVAFICVLLFAISVKDIQFNQESDNRNQMQIQGEKGHYTYQYQQTSIDNWNPLLVNSQEQKEVLRYLFSPLYTVAWNDAKSSGVIEPILATKAPVDTTKHISEKEEYGIPADAAANYAWTIKIKKNAVWQDGSKITTADFAYTILQSLDPKRESQEDSLFLNGRFSLANAKKYHNKNMICVDADGNEINGVTEEQLLFSLDEPIDILGGVSLSEYYAYHSVDSMDLFRTSKGTNLYLKLKKAVGNHHYVKVNKNIKSLLNLLCSNFGQPEESYRKMCFYKDVKNAVDFSKVGFIANNERSMTFVFEQPVTANELMYALSDFCVVKKSLYKQAPELYGTQEANTSSYGPYKLVEYDKEKEMVFERNDSWFGYEEKQFEGQYQTTDIRILFEKTDENLLSCYETSPSSEEDQTQTENQRYEKNTSTGLYLLNSDLSDLSTKNQPNENHSILAYRDFRNAISLMFDRKEYLSELGISGVSNLGLINETYFWSIGRQTMYRNLPEAQKVIESVYGADSKEYHPIAASKKFLSAYRVCLADGNINDTDRITLTFDMSGNDVEMEKEISFLQKKVDEAVSGTELENRIKIVPMEKDGIADIYKVNWSGNIYDVFGSMGDWCDSRQTRVKGLFPAISLLTITIGEDPVTKTYEEWYQSLIRGEYKDASIGVRKKILCRLEKAILQSYTVIPLYREGKEVVYHSRVIPGQNYLNALEGYGGLRYLTYTMDDQQWANTYNK